MKDSIKLLENMIDNNSLQMKLLAFEYIRGEHGRRDLKVKFQELENKNVALNEAIDILYSAMEEKNDWI